MERDLDDVIRDSLAARERHETGMVPPAGWTADVRSGVRRRRRRRHAVQGFAAVGALAVVGAGVLLGGQRSADERLATTPEPTPATTTAAAPTPTPTQTLPPEPTPTRVTSPDAAALAAGLGLPETVAVDDTTWAKVGTGWALGVYRPRWNAGDGDDHAIRNTVVLASPSGDAYRLFELPADREVNLLAWDSSSRRALVTIAQVHGTTVATAVRGWLDLRTGALTTEPGAAGQEVDGHDAQLTRLTTTERGDEVWFVTYGQTGGGGPATIVVQHPDGRLVRRIEVGSTWASSRVGPGAERLVMPSEADPDGLTYDLVDLTTGTVTTRSYAVAHRFCQVVGWRTESVLLATCKPTSWQESGYTSSLLAGGQELYDISVDGAAPRKLRVVGDGDPAVTPWQGVPVGEDVAVGAPPVGTSDGARCADGAYLVGTERSTAIAPQRADRVQPAQSLGGRLYGDAVLCPSATADDESPGQVELWSTDDTGHRVVLAPPRDDVPQLEGGLESWVVADGPNGRG